MELLVVVSIMAVLAAIVTPAVLRARSAARNAAIKVEIDMLHMALMNYKNEYGSFPPCFDTNPAAPLTNGQLTSVSQRHLARLFPRCSIVPAQFSGATPLTPQNAIASWLLGYTNDPTSPLQPPASRKKLYDFDQSRLAGGSYAPPGKTESPYIYIDAANYLQSPTTVRTFTGLSGGSYFAQRLPTVVAPNNFQNVNQPAFNPDTFQILCAGADGVFGNDDDLSNFWKGTRREYLDSLQNQ